MRFSDKWQMFILYSNNNLCYINYNTLFIIGKLASSWWKSTPRTTRLWCLQKTGRCWGSRQRAIPEVTSPIWPWSRCSVQSESFRHQKNGNRKVEQNARMLKKKKPYAILFRKYHNKSLCKTSLSEYFMIKRFYDGTNISFRSLFNQHNESGEIL